MQARSVLPIALALLAASCSAGSAPGADRSERFSVERFDDGGFAVILRGAGAKSFDGPRDVVAAADGSFVVVGGTESADFPTTPGAHRTQFATGGTQLGGFPEMDVFVTRLEPDGTIRWSTFLGGPNYDRAYAVELDAEGNVLVAGRAGAGFPTTKGVVQEDFAGDADANRAYGPQDGFVAKLSGEGRLLWATYLGDASMTFIRDMDVDAEGNVYAALMGRGELPHVPAGAWQAAPGGGTDDAIVKLSPDGRRVLWATYLGRDGDEGNPTLRVDDAGGVVVLTCTTSDGWVEDEAAFQRERAGAQDLLLLRLSPEGVPTARTYLGGSDDDVTETHHLALAPDGRVAIGVPTRSRDLPIPEAGALRSRHGPEDYDGYAALLSPGLDTLLAATYLGNTGMSGGFEGIAVDGAGNFHLGGSTGGGLPTTPGAPQRELGGDRDAFVAKLSPDLRRALFLSYWGGPGPEGQRALHVAGDGSIVSVGQSAGDVFVRRFVIPVSAR